jgi:hypothetical protein
MVETDHTVRTVTNPMVETDHTGRTVTNPIVETETTLEEQLQTQW